MPKFPRLMLGLALFALGLSLGGVFAPHAQAQDPFAALEAYLQAFQAQTPYPGFAVTIVRDQKVIFEKGYGVEVIGQPAPMTAQSAFAIGALTKSFTALAIMQQVEQGRIELDAPVTRYLPWFRTANRDLSDLITVRMLLNNNSGLPTVNSAFILGETEAAIEQTVRALSAVQIRRQPGSVFEYSNEGWVTLGLILKEVTGQSYADYLQEHIFDSLDMARTTTDRKRFDTIQALYGHESGITTALPVVSHPRFIAAALPAGSELRSTTRDLSHYLRMLLNNGQYQDQQLITPASLQQMWTPGTYFEAMPVEMGGNGSQLGYGFGWMTLEDDGHQIVLHGGETGRTASLAMLWPQKNLAAAVLFNLTGVLDPYRYTSTTTLTYNILRLVNGEPLSTLGVPRRTDPNLTEPFITLPTTTLEKYAGEYLNELGTTSYLTLTAQGELEAMLDLGIGQAQVRLDFLDEARFVAQSIRGTAPGYFTLAPNGQVESVHVLGQNLRRKQRGAAAGFSAQTSPNGRFTLNVITGWEVQWAEAGFTLINPNHPAQRLVSFVPTAPVSDLPTLLAQALPTAQVQYVGAEFIERWFSGLWQIQAFALTDAGTAQQCLAAYAADKNIALYLCAPPGQITQLTQTLLVPIFNSLVIASPPNH